MTGEEGHKRSKITDHSAVAENLLRVLEAFADEFTERSAPATLSNVLRDGTYLKAEQIGQKPERFVERSLVQPMLDVFGYEIIEQPYGYPKWDKTYPDFSVRNFDCGVECLVVGEVKTPNKFEYAENDIDNYLKKDLNEATVGFATDGVEWAAKARPERSGETTEIGSVDLQDAFEKLSRRHEENQSYQKHATRQDLGDIDALTRSAIEAEASEVLGAD
jgi:hypothetical protein